MKILTAVILFIINIVLLTIIFFVLYLIIKPIVYNPTTEHSNAVIGQANLFLVTTSQALITDTSVSTNPAEAILDAIVSVPSSSVNNLRIFPSSRSTAYQPVLTNAYPQVSISMTNLTFSEGDHVTAEVNANIMVGNRTSGVTQFIYYYDYISEIFGEKYIYICPDGIYNGDNILNKIVISMTKPGAGNISLRLVLPDSVYSEICFIESTTSGTSATTISTFFCRTNYSFI